MLRKILTAIILCNLLAACASAAQIRSDFDKSIDFSNYKTFAFIQPLATD